MGKWRLGEEALLSDPGGLAQRYREGRKAELFIVPWLRPGLEKGGALPLLEATHLPMAGFQSQVSGAAEASPDKDVHRVQSKAGQELRTVGLPAGSKWGGCGASSSPPSFLGAMLLVRASGASVSPR